MGTQRISFLRRYSVRSRREGGSERESSGKGQLTLSLTSIDLSCIAVWSSSDVLENFIQLMMEQTFAERRLEGFIFRWDDKIARI